MIARSVWKLLYSIKAIPVKLIAVKKLRKTNENTTLVFSISFQRGLVNQHFCFHQPDVFDMFYQNIILYVFGVSVCMV